MGIVTKIVTGAVKPVERIITKEGRRLVPLAQYSGVPNLTKGQIWKIKKNNFNIKQLTAKAEEIYSELQRGLSGDIKVQTKEELKQVMEKISYLKKQNRAIRGLDEMV